MDRLELIRGIVDKEIAKIQDEEIRKFAYIHTYGVAQMSALLATIRSANIELASISAMLHDIAMYMENCSHKDHAKRSSELAKDILTTTGLFQEDEITIITHVIAAHSEKMNRHDGVITEIIKDSDVMQHYLYNTNIELSEKDRFRLFYLLEDLKQIQLVKSKPRLKDVV